MNDDGFKKVLVLALHISSGNVEEMEGHMGRLSYLVLITTMKNENECWSSTELCCINCSIFKSRLSSVIQIQSR